MIRNLGAEEEAKLRLIHSISRSQMAMARILESIAEVSQHSGETSRQLARNIRVLTRYQDAMARTVCGISLHRVYYGTPSSPWIMKSCYPAYKAAQGEQEDGNGKEDNSAQPRG